MDTETETSSAADPETRSAQELACGYIRSQILSGTLSAGTRLKTERLAEVIGISRMPVREALRQLHSEGLIELRPNRGAVVTSLSANDVQQLFEIRAVLEGLAARLACAHLTEEAVADLEDRVARMERANTDPQLWLERHEELHEAISRCSRSPRIIQQLKTARIPLFPYIRMYIAVYHQVEVQGAEHKTLLEIAKRRNPELFEATMRDHVLSTARAVTDFLRRTAA
jgi:DNA-binding GntR family transcriptional regulator